MSFFTFDLEQAIVQGEWITSPNISGQVAQQKRMELNPAQMDMFNLLDITKFADGTIWLDFLSDKYAPNKSLMDFMAYCANKWGNDSLGRNVPTERDMPDLRNGTFGRTWTNVKITQIKRPEKLSLTIVLRIIIDNQDMSNFAKELAKGFVRSAVNQVARDGGRVISNNLYNGQNYVPLNNVGNNQPTNNNVNSSMPRTTQSSPSLGTGPIILIVLGALSIPIGSVAVIIYGLTRYLKKTTKVTWEEERPQYVQANRYNSGRRFIGNMVVKRSSVIQADDFFKSEYRKQGIIIMAVGALSLILGIISLVFS